MTRVIERKGPRATRQLALPMPPPRPAHGGRRAGAGRKRRAKRPCTPHVVRPIHHERHPVHITLRASRAAGDLRKQVVLRTLADRFRRAAKEDTFRVVHFSVQTDHVHLIVEADDRDVLVRKMTGLTTWIARRLNALAGRRGRFWADRYNRRDLRSPREVRNALVYVLQNRRKHVLERTGRDIGGMDVFSSAAWLEGWSDDAEVWLRSTRAQAERALRPSEGASTAPVHAPSTWLARIGWRRARGPLSLRELPARA